MQIEPLVKFKNDILAVKQELSLEETISLKREVVANIRCRHNIEDYEQDLDTCLNVYNQLIHTNENIYRSLDILLEKIENDIESEVVKKSRVKDEESSIRNHLSTSDAIEKIICPRISSYSDWRFPGMQLHCRYFRPDNINNPIPENFANPKYRINSMVALDPLYLVGSDIYHMKETISHFTALYQSRLRLYEIKERNLTTLPHAQFAFILCWDFLNYLSIDTVKWYLDECMKLLRPGGVMMFSYNNGDIESSARMFDQGRAEWATSKIIEKLVLDTGFTVIRSENYPTKDNEDTWVSWYEIKKPGELKTVRLSQAMGQVLIK